MSFDRVRTHGLYHTARGGAVLDDSSMIGAWNRGGRAHGYAKASLWT